MTRVPRRRGVQAPFWTFWRKFMNSIKQSGRRGIVVDFDLYGLVWWKALASRARIPKKIDDSVHLLCLSFILIKRNRKSKGFYK
jgi:hypothetical protein